MRGIRVKFNINVIRFSVRIKGNVGMYNYRMYIIIGRAIIRRIYIGYYGNYYNWGSDK